MSATFVRRPAADVARWRAAGLWEDLTIFAMVERTARRRPDHPALVAGALRLSYADLVGRAKTLAAGLRARGIASGDRVVVQLPNVAEFAIVYLALARIGAIPVMALRAHRHAEVRHFVGASRASAYVIPDVVGAFDYRTLAATLQDEFPGLSTVVVVGEARAGQVAYADLVEDSADDADAPPVDPLAVGTMLLSGGTTSMSKLIPRTHADYVLNARLCGAAAGFGDDTVFMAVLPLGHNYNLASPGLLGTWYHGGTVVLAPTADADGVFALVERERVTVVAAAVPLIAQWLASDVPARHDLSSLAVVQNGGARLPPELRARVRERFGCTPQEIYGTAEGLINMTRLDDPDDLLLESSGRPVSDLDEIKVVDDDDREVPDGVAGELLTRGPYTIGAYWGDDDGAAEKNREAFTADGFYRMGDIVRKRGRHLYTEGRRKDLVNRGGEKISCDEVENLVHGHPAVRSVVLVAVPDPVFGERACACVVLEPGASLDLATLVAFLKTKGIASFKLPERLEVMDAFPISPVGKIMKRELRERLATRLPVPAPTTT